MNRGAPSPAEVLARAAKYAPFVLISGHAYGRMLERGVRRGDITSALRTATRATDQHDGRTWKIEGGVDLDGEELVVVVAQRSTGYVVVTVFGSGVSRR